MTGPINFAPIPHPVLDDPCDGVGAYRGVSDVATANFGLINTRITTATPRWSVLSAAQGPVAIYSGNTWDQWQPMDANVFGGLDFILPACTAMLVINWANINASSTNTAPNPYLLYTVEITGSGLTAPLAKGWLSIGTRNQNGIHAGSRSYLFTGSALNPGGLVSIRPWVNYGNATLATLSGAYVQILLFNGASP